MIPFLVIEHHSIDEINVISILLDHMVLLLIRLHRTGYNRYEHGERDESGHGYLDGRLYDE